jgi:hypothetical protein
MTSVMIDRVADHLARAVHGILLVLIVLTFKDYGLSWDEPI